MKDNKDVPRLQKQFILTFSYPMIIVAFISLIMTVIFMNIYRQALVTRKEILNIIEEITEEKAMPIVQLAINETQLEFQLYIDNLMKIKDQFEANRKLLKYSAFDSILKEKYVNALSYYSNRDSNEDDCYYDKGRWFVNPTITDLSSLSLMQKTRLYEVMSTFDLLNAIIKVSPNSDKVFFTFDSIELYVDYPLAKQSPQDEFKKYNHSDSCRNKEDQFPEYYYFKCRPYYRSINNKIGKETSNDNNTMLISITNQYKFPNEKEGLSVCISYTLIEKEVKETVSICENFTINQLTTNLEQYNNLINGYFFIIQINFGKPIYYPNKSISDSTKSSFVQMEFDLTNEYYLDEISEYNTKLKNLLKLKADSRLKNPYTTFLNKNGKSYAYTLYSINLECKTADETKECKIDSDMILVYVNPNGKDYKLKIDSNEITIFITILFLVMGLFMILVSQYSIVAIAHTVVKPIRNIKGLLEKMDNNTELGDSTAYQLNSTDGRSSLNKKKAQIHSDEEDDNEQDDKIVTTRSQNLQMLFIKLVDLKNSFRVIQEISAKTFTLPLLSHALDTFDKITNESASRICHSNISNLFLNLETYDKAISHLNDVLKPLFNKIIQLKGDSLEQAKKLIKNEYVPLRYLKLFYCYKEHFKGIKGQALLRNEQNKLFNCQLIISHTEEEYGQHVNNFVLLMNHVQDYRNIYNSFLEKLELIIKYKMKKELYFGQKAALVKEVFNLFKQLDEIKETKDLKEYTKTATDDIVMTEIEILNSIDIPISVMIQRTHYLKANFFLKSSQYIKAVEYFNQALNFKSVGNKTIIIHSLNKLNKIAAIYSKWISVELDFHNRERRLKHLVQEDQKNKAQVESFISKNNFELSKFQCKQKDVCFIINSRLFTKQNENIILLRYIVDIFNTNINNEDNCCILLYQDNDFKILMTFTRKRADNAKSIEKMIMGYAKMEYPDGDKVDRNSTEIDFGIMGKIIKYSLAFMNKKKLALDTLRESWYIYMTKDSPRTIFELLKKKRLKEYYDNTPEQNMVLFLYDNGNIKEEDIDLIDKLMQYNKSAVICRNNLNKLDHLMGVCAKEHQNLFQLEKFIENN